MSVNITEEQREAIEARGKVIVSASAGSGKTFVMIERLVSLILSKEATVQEVLAVTFTNKAAAQMRERLRKAILNRIATCSQGELAYLKEQLSALPLADISTIHAFCARLLRTNFFYADVDPAFRIISPDDAEGTALSARAMDEVFERGYEEENGDFRRLLSVYFRKKKDRRLRRIVLSLHASARGLSGYRELLAKAGKRDDFGEACAYLARHFKSRAQFIFDEVEDMGAFFAERSPRAFNVCKAVSQAAGGLCGKADLFAMTQAAAVTPAIPVMPPATKAEGEELRLLKRLSAMSKSVKELYRDLREFAPEETERARYLDARERAGALCALALEYDGVYARLKREAGVLDYNDLEQFALQVLSRGEVREALREKYKFVFVDEYQDVNPVQEEILSLVSGGETFLVGDAKQAIYGFRGSRSDFFLQKEKSLERSLRLTANFRSSPEVLEAVNRVFTPLMPAYAPMRGGERYAGHGGSVRFCFVGQKKPEKKEPSVYSVLSGAGERETDASAEAVLRTVREELGSDWYDADEGCVKKVEYGDIAVLVRKNTGDAERIVRLLGEYGVPVTTSSKVNVCDFFEARLLIDWLSYLDNAQQDIPLAGAMLSAIGGFTDSDLAAIRLAYRDCFTFRKACELYCAKKRDALSHKLLSFSVKAEKYRALSRVRTAAEMIDLLLSEGLEAQICAKGDGKNRLARVRRLAAEAESCADVHGFLRRLKACEYSVDYCESGGENAVKVLTMHASKGLEYPVVILASMDAPFHGAERDEVMWTEKFLAAPKSCDAEKKLAYETVLRRASSVLQEEEEIKGELNLLYVAMTRARCRLHLMFEGREGAVSPAYAKRFSDFFDFHACADYFTAESEAELPPLERKALVYRCDGDIAEKILSVYRKPYAYEESSRLRVKSSATELMRESEEKRYLRGSVSESGTAEEGIAYHAFLQYCEFGKEGGEQLARMTERGLITPEQARLLDAAKLNKILRIPCLAALAGKRLRREQKFLVSLPACEMLGGGVRDEIVFQGAIDLLCEDEDGYTVIDYKYSSLAEEDLREKYAVQIRLYRKAVAQAMRVDEKKVRARIVNIMQGREIVM